MLKKLKSLRIFKKFSLTFSPKALLFLRSVGSLFYEQILEFLVFRFSLSKTYCYCLPVLLSRKEENYFNFEDFTCKKFNCLTVLVYRTNKIHYSVLKELIVLILYIRQKLKENFNLLSQSLIHPLPQGEGFSETFL
jgi:hypothetical protein